MTLAVVSPNWFDRPPMEALAVADHADRLGYDEFWVGEMMTTEAFALAGAAARSTSRIRVWVGPLAVGVRDAVTLAMGVTTVSALGDRPAHLALGASNPLVVEGWHERPWAAPVDRTAATVAALRSLFAGERSSGGFRLRMEGAATEIGVAAFGPAMLRLAADVADRVVVNLLTPAQVARVRTAIGAAPLVAWVPAAFRPGPAAAEQLRRQLAPYRSAPGYREMLAEVDSVVELAVLGDERALRAGVERYRDAGADIVAVVPVTAEDPGGEKVLTALAGC